MNNKSALAIGLSALMLLGVTVASSQSAYAHTFSGDESASFLALIEQMKVELQLVKSNLSTNATLAAEHAEHSTEHLTEDIIKEIAEKNERLGRDVPASLNDLQETLESGNFTATDIDVKIADINDLLDETLSVRIASTQLSNSTVLALELANIVDETLEHYNGAYGIEEEHEEGEEHDEEEGSMNMTGDYSTETRETEENSNSSDESSTASEDELEHTTIVDVAHYQSAQALVMKAQDLFDSKLRAMADVNATQAVADLDAGLKHLKQAIDGQEPHDDVDVIVHSEVHPNIQSAYNLQIIPEFPLPLLMVVSTLGAVVAATRLSVFGRR
jgi:hypothetical protein